MMFESIAAVIYLRSFITQLCRVCLRNFQSPAGAEHSSWLQAPSKQRLVCGAPLIGRKFKVLRGKALKAEAAAHRFNCSEQNQMARNLMLTMKIP